MTISDFTADDRYLPAKIDTLRTVIEPTGTGHVSVPPVFDPTALPSEIDLLVIGGGINGAGIARDAAGRGLKVALCERHDLASATSSASSKLIHGGLRYLEQYEFRLVRESLAEREVLLSNAPHIVSPLRFVLPHDRHLRPAWLIRLGLFLYDHLSRRSVLPSSQRLDLRLHPAGIPLQERLKQGFMYSDCRVNDARLVVLNARDAADRGALILPRTECMHLERTPTHWQARLRHQSGQTHDLTTKAVVNAAGPWVSQVRAMAQNTPPASCRVRLVKGSHIIVPRLYQGDHAYILQNDDQRIVFVLPYTTDTHLIGTTDVAFDGDPANIQISAEETDYLCAVVNSYFDSQIEPSQILHTFAGVRPLYDDQSNNPSKVTRDYLLDMNGDLALGQPPILSVYGGKLTTYRRLAEQVMAKLAGCLGARPPWTATAPLPGGDIEHGDVDGYIDDLLRSHPWLPADLANRYAHTYGSLTTTLLQDAHSLDDLGEHLGDGLYVREADWLRTHEWAETSEDILWRRTWLGLSASPDTVATLERWLART